MARNRRTTISILEVPDYRSAENLRTHEPQLMLSTSLWRELD
jgi:hypothetical protein